MIREYGGLKLQEALYGLLDDQLETSVYDYVPKKAGYPYVRLGNESNVDDSTKTHYRTKMKIDIQVFTTNEGYKEAKLIMNEIYKIISNKSNKITLDSFVVTLDRLISTTFYEVTSDNPVKESVRIGCATYQFNLQGV